MIRRRAFIAGLGGAVAWPVAAWAQLDRLARHKRYSVTVLIEELAASAERRTVAKLTGRAPKVYLDGE